MTAKEFWDKIKMSLSDQGKTFVWLCQQAGVSVQIMKNRIYKKRIPDVEDTLKMMAVLGTTVEDFFGLEAQFSSGTDITGAADSEKIPVYKQIFSFNEEHKDFGGEYIDGYIEIPEDLQSKRFHGHLAAGKIHGDSMEPAAFNDDIVIYDDLGYQEDGIYAIIFGKKGFVKRLQWVAVGVKIISDNPAYESVFAENDSKELEIIGKVHYVLHKV